MLSGIVGLPGCLVSLSLWQNQGNFCKCSKKLLECLSTPEADYVFVIIGGNDFNSAWDTKKYLQYRIAARILQ